MTLLAADQLFAKGIDLTVVLIVIGKTVAVFAVVLLSVLFYIWFMRKVIADMQNRIGPQRAGPFGVLQTLADGIKAFFKEASTPAAADRRVYMLAPYLALIPAVMAFAIVPIGGEVSIAGHRTYLQLADPGIGILWLLMMSGIGLYGVMLAGWSSGSKYPLLGSVRASAQMVSYEAALGLSLASVLLVAGTLSTSGIVAAQSSLADWHVVSTGVVPFVIFLIAATAELNRPPFDLVEAEQELVGGFNTEYSSIRFALFYLAEFMNTVSMSAFIVTLFFGGPQPVSVGGVTLDIPLVPNGLEGTIWLLLKVMVFLYVYVWFRATLPRLRYDQLMDLGWKVLIPASLAWFLLLAAQRLARDLGWNVLVTTAASVVVLGICYFLMLSAFSVSNKTRHSEGAQF